MRKRRRTKYSWLLNTGTQGPAAAVTDSFAGRDFGIITSPATGESALGVVDLVNDFPSDDTTTNFPMGVYTQDEYFIKRIVGKFWIECGQNSAAGTAGAVIVGAGIFVARAGDEGNAVGDANRPLGMSAGGAALFDQINYNPLDLDVIREPWIWRRTWVLGNQANADASDGRFFPRTTADYGSVADGPHIDAKTARRVGKDERLWAIVGVRNYPVNGVETTAIAIRATIDYRVLGAMRRSKGRSAF